MCTFRTLTTVSLVLVLAAGGAAAERKGGSGNHHTKAKVQQPNRTKAAQVNGKFAPASLRCPTVGTKQEPYLTFAPKSGARSGKTSDPEPSHGDTLTHELKTGSKVNPVSDAEFNPKEEPAGRSRSSRKGMLNNKYPEGAFSQKGGATPASSIVGQDQETGEIIVLGTGNWLKTGATTGYRRGDH